MIYGILRRHIKGIALCGLIKGTALRGLIKGTAVKPHYLVLCYKTADGKRSLEESDSGSGLKKKQDSLFLKKIKEEKEASRFASPKKRKD